MDDEVTQVIIQNEIPILTEKEWNEMTNNLECSTLTISTPPTPDIKLPEAVFSKLDGYELSDAPVLRDSFIRFIENSDEEFEGTVEYDVDEEDTDWLADINKKRSEEGVDPVGVNTLEIIIDRFEKESFRTIANGQEKSNKVNEDEVCSICMDDKTDDTNGIVLCDSCNIAVHQNCYGVPFIPEGQWLCRSCYESPKKPVQCVLCPNPGGALKKTVCNRWVHVACALWIPEVKFANIVYMEPIYSLETIPRETLNFCCFICQQKQKGVCIQCQFRKCSTVFHVTCAQLASLCMGIDVVEGNTDSVKMTAYCHKHGPNVKSEDVISDARKKISKRMLTKKRARVPLIFIPTITQERVEEISSLVDIQGKSEFFKCFIAYWILKRRLNNGLPLLRRFKNRYLLHVRKRQRCMEAVMAELLDALCEKDVDKIFCEPVNTEEVFDYLKVIQQPMDLSQMKEKLQTGEYSSFSDMEADFKLMIENCCTYNHKTTIYYKAGKKMQRIGKRMFSEAREEFEHKVNSSFTTTLQKDASQSDVEEMAVCKEISSCSQLEITDDSMFPFDAKKRTARKASKRKQKTYRKKELLSDSFAALGKRQKTEDGGKDKVNSIVQVIERIPEAFRAHRTSNNYNDSSHEVPNVSSESTCSMS